MEYKIITSYDARELEQRVKMGISAGWIPQGGLVGYTTSGELQHCKPGDVPRVCLAQAMIRTEASMRVAAKQEAIG